ncbi:MAG: carboxypeptidase regulatory-like domain-containing protein [Alphaproteobacteria bacterium]|nr:carboxypeptidase regulatory-like domain-containing protein [Alphaproteobacteria bacterium]
MWWFLACSAPPPEPMGTEATWLGGTVVDAEGAPLDGARLQACAEVCAVADSDADGVFAFEGLWDGAWSLHATGPGPDDAELVLPVDLRGSREVRVVVPTLGPPVAVPETPTWVEVAPGLTLRLSAGDLPGITEVRAGSLDPSWLGDGLPGEAVGGWSLSPFGAGMGVAFETGAEVACTSPDGTAWEACDGALPAFGSIATLR